MVIGFGANASPSSLTTLKIKDRPRLRAITERIRLSL